MFEVDPEPVEEGSGLDDCRVELTDVGCELVGEGSASGELSEEE